MHIEGRIPKACSDKYRDLLKKNKIENIEEKHTNECITEEKFIHLLNKAFTPDQEKEILTYILQLIDDGKFLTSKDISTTCATISMN